MWALSKDRFFVTALALTKIGDFKVDFLREFKSHIQKGFNPCIGARGGVV
jgi:hypothetical protein